MFSKKTQYYMSPSGREIPIFWANTFKARLVGLMGKKEGVYGLMITPCNSIHTCFMKYPIDVVFLDEENHVVAIKRYVKPFSIVLPVKGAVKAVEFPSTLNALAFLSPGTQIKFYQKD